MPQSDRQIELDMTKKHLVVARHFHCYKDWCRKYDLNPHNGRTLYISSADMLRGHGEDTEIIIVCGGPIRYSMPLSDISADERRSPIALQRILKEREHALNMHQRLWDEIRLLEHVRGVMIKDDTCS